MLGAVVVAVVALCAIYADILRAAFAQNPIPSSHDSIARGREIFQQNCSVCHGPEGAGDGPAASALPVRPEDLSTIASPPVFPDGVVAYLIANGVNGMPAWKTVLTENQIWDVLNYIRSLRSKHP